jgi:hypothetical protein
MKRLSSVFSKSEKACARCKTMCGSLKGLQALISTEGYEHYNLSELNDHSKRGCTMCFKILEALEDNGIEDEPRNPGWINFFALDAERKRITGSLPVMKNTLPPEVKRMRYLEAEGPKKNDFLIFMICSGECEWNSSGRLPVFFTNNFRLSGVPYRSSTHIILHEQ